MFSCLFIYGSGISPILELINLARLAYHPGVCLFPPPQRGNYKCVLLWLAFFMGSMGWNSGLCVCVISTLWLAHLPSPQKTLSIHSFTEWTLWFWGMGGLTHNVWCGLGVTCPPKAPALEAGIVVIFGGGHIWGVGPRGQRLSHGHLKGLNLVWGLLDLVRVT